MAVLARNVMNAIWHAFDALDDNKDGKVTKSRLKVLTASLGTLMGCHGVEKGLPEHRSTSYLNFNDFMYYLEKELFTSPGLLESKDIRRYTDEIEEVCWLVCKHQFQNRDFVAFPDNGTFQLFRIFCLLGGLQSSNGLPAEVTMYAEEVEQVAHSFITALGLEWDQDEFNQIRDIFPTFTFKLFLTLMETRYTKKAEILAVIETINDLHDTLVKDVIKKGSIKKRITPLGLWWEMWFVLQPHTLSWYSNREQTEKRGEVALYTTCKVESVIQQSSGAKGSQFILVTPSKTIELCAEDCKSKLQWITALEIAIQHSQSPDSYQRQLTAKRKKDLEIAWAKAREEKARQLEEKMAFEAEKLARAEAEYKLTKESQLRKELEENQQLMNRLLEEERQAKRDEEIVRSLTSRMLAEEWERREELEKLHEEQAAELEEEKNRREVLEAWQTERQAELEMLSNKLDSLENEKQNLCGTLERTKRMLTVAEHASKTLEKQIKTKPLQRALSADLSSHIKSGCWTMPISVDDVKIPVLNISNSKVTSDESE